MLSPPPALHAEAGVSALGCRTQHVVPLPVVVGMHRHDHGLRPLRGNRVEHPFGDDTVIRLDGCLLEHDRIRSLSAGPHRGAAHEECRRHTQRSGIVSYGGILATPTGAAQSEEFLMVRPKTGHKSYNHIHVRRVMKTSRQWCIALAVAISRDRRRLPGECTGPSRSPVTTCCSRRARSRAKRSDQTPASCRRHR